MGQGCSVLPNLSDRFAISTRVSKPSNLEAWTRRPQCSASKVATCLARPKSWTICRTWHHGDLLYSCLYLDGESSLPHVRLFFRGSVLAATPHCADCLTRRTRVTSASCSTACSTMPARLLPVQSRAGKRRCLALSGLVLFQRRMAQGRATAGRLPAQRFKGYGGKLVWKQLGYRAWWDLPALPKLNITHLAVREFIFDVAKFWIDFGIDGWRWMCPARLTMIRLERVPPPRQGRESRSVHRGRSLGGCAALATR